MNLKNYSLNIPVAAVGGTAHLDLVTEEGHRISVTLNAVNADVGEAISDFHARVKAEIEKIVKEVAAAL